MLINKLPQGINSNINDEVSSLSGGERKKIALIRAIIKNPDLLILDEPTNGLDSSSIQNLTRVLLGMKNEKIIILVSHDSEVINICDEIINLNIFKNNKFEVVTWKNKFFFHFY